ncbi:MAG: multidrug ABC transporter ATP-binding protein [Thermonema sp.]|uniref:gliding motility-associated ABC transporter ATP-binding subunit GldA n=1 Tax=Thermonema sp. TaxID=2231181 RepID=UPI0021DF38B0|nr:gliding motility-associated ABC transporter ATP-binding subunit GldA [Thermonema sp.]GIV39079.1 MAG: multidrug ABC transporter ATP-binding protein [Thermonema sp.]
MSVVVEHLSKLYGSQRAVDDISFEAQTGQIVGFLGPNGAGKSTTMKMICGYLTPNAGHVRVCGYEVGTQSMEVRRRIGYLPEHNPLYTDMYVREFLRFIGHIHGIRDQRLSRRVEEMVALCGLEREQHKKIGALSKGYRQRVGLAQALIHDPPVLILDEPTSGLDPNQIAEIRQVIKEAAANKTIIFSTHILQEVEMLCDRVIIINRGRLVADASMTELRRMMQHRVVCVEFGHAVESTLLEALPGVHQVQQSAGFAYRISCEDSNKLRPALLALIQQNGWNMLSLQNESNRLEDIFRQLTQNTNEAI